MAVTDNATTGGTDPSGQPPAALIEATTALLTAVTAIKLPLDLPTADPARRARTEIEHILTAAILPRLRTPDAPLLCALAGPTGVGKSTLLNALAGAPVSATGPFRPTTRTPVLVCHPADLAESVGAGAGEQADGAGHSEGGSAAAEMVRAADHRRVPDGHGLISAGQIVVPAADEPEDSTSAETSSKQAVGQAADGGRAGRVDESGGGHAGQLGERTDVSEIEAGTGESEADAEASAGELSADAEASDPSGEAEVGASDPSGEAEVCASEPEAVASASVDTPAVAGSAQAEGSQLAEKPVLADMLAHAEEPVLADTLARAEEPVLADTLAHAEEPVPADTLAHADAALADAAGADLSRAVVSRVAVGRIGRGGGGGAAGLGARVGAGLASLLSSPLPSPSLPRGVALVDTVDGDVTVVEAADVVVVVVSAERYADAAVWRVLRRVGGWGAPIVVVLGRVAAEVVEEVSGAFVELLRVNGLGAVPYFVVEEVGDGAGARGVVQGAGDAQRALGLGREGTHDEAARGEAVGDGSVQARGRDEGQARGLGDSSVTPQGEVVSGELAQGEAAGESSGRGGAADEGAIQGEVGSEGSARGEVAGESPVRAAEAGRVSARSEAVGEGSVQAAEHGEASAQGEAGSEGSGQGEAVGGGSAQVAELGDARVQGEGLVRAGGHGEVPARSEAVGEGSVRNAEHGEVSARGEAVSEGSVAAPEPGEVLARGEVVGDGSAPVAGQGRLSGPGEAVGDGPALGSAGADGDVEADGEGARARGTVANDSGAPGVDEGRSGSGAGVGGGAPGSGGYGDGGLGCAGEPAGGTGMEIGDGDGAGLRGGGAEVGSGVAASGVAVGTGTLGVGAPVAAGAGGQGSVSGIGDVVPLLPAAAVAGLRGWLMGAGADTAGRVRIGMLGVAGRLDSVDILVGELADAWEGQRLALQVLHQGLERVHTAERVRFRGAVDGGELLGGEVRIRWQELLGSGRVSALFGAEDGAGGKRRGRRRAEADWSARFHNPTAHDAATAPLRAALVEAVARGHRGALERAARKTVEQWELTPGAPEPGQLDEATRRATDPAKAAAEWLDQLPTVILDQAHSRRTTKTIGPAGAHIRSAALVLGVAALAGSDTQADAKADAQGEGGTEDSAAEAATALLRTMFGEDADRLLATATTALKDANARLLNRAAQPHRAQLAAYTLDPRQAQALADARAAVKRARNEEEH